MEMPNTIAVIVKKLVPSAFPHKLYFVDKLDDYSYDKDGKGKTPAEGKLVKTTDKANVVSSETSNGMHTVMLDLDVPAKLFPSSTEGHSHLYIDVQMDWHRYARLLAVLADCGIIEEGYLHHSLKKQATFLRLPWIKKNQQAKVVVDEF